MDLKNKTALVTGSSSGIGQAIAIELAKAGADVLIHYRKNKDGAEKTLKAVKKHANGEIYQADLSEPNNVKKLFETIQIDWPKLDILVNCAGEYQSGDLDNFGVWQSEFQNIFFSAVYVTSEFLKTKGTGKLRKIVNISSWYGFLETGVPNGLAYCAAKAALNSLTANLAKKLAPEILVNAVAPGYTWTPNWEGTPEKEIQIAKDLSRIKRFVTPEEIASMVMELLKNDAVTGEIIRVDGGLHLPEVL